MRGLAELSRKGRGLDAGSGRQLMGKPSLQSINEGEFYEMGWASEGGSMGKCSGGLSWKVPPGC